MCDYSLMHAKFRPAVKDEELVVHYFGNGSCGLRSIKDDEVGACATAVCVLPGTQLAVEDISVDPWVQYDKSKPANDQAIFNAASAVADQTAVFAKRDDIGQYHDALEFADGTFVPVSKLKCGGRVRVLQMPAEPIVEQAAPQGDQALDHVQRVIDEARAAFAKQYDELERVSGPVT